MYFSSRIITGEKIQMLCDIYLGLSDDFYYNPKIGFDVHKHLDLNFINNEFDNPYKIFCYSHRLNILSSKVHFFKNKFILVTHNSDDEIVCCGNVLKILQCPNLEKWYAQNIRFTHDKLRMIPIGIANSMWPHGDLTIFNENEFINSMNTKTQKVYFNFNIDTNPNKRTRCYNELINKVPWLLKTFPKNNLRRLKEYEFCICPEGNGCDTHRLWEALYTNTVPIVIKSDFTDVLQQYNVPLLVLDNWSDLDVTNLKYQDYNFNDEKFQNLITFHPSYI
jgi:hypothetical protein